MIYSMWKITNKPFLNLGACGIDTIYYNFTFVLDWTNTDLDYIMENGATALRFDAAAFPAFELCLLKRPGAEAIYTKEQKGKARKYLDKRNQKEREQLINTIIAGLPGAEEGYSLQESNTILTTYDSIGPKELKKHLFDFLSQIIPVAEKARVLMYIHLDDPPYSIIWLPRVVSTEQDILGLYKAVDSPNNGLTLCTGSFGVREDNDLPGMVERLGHRIHFIYLRSTTRDDESNFQEVNHVEGDMDMCGVKKALIKEQFKRNASGRKYLRIPMRPDYGHKMLDDLHKKRTPVTQSLVG